MEATRTQETSDGAIAEAALFDDEGNAINPVLLEKAKRHREQRKKKKGRKRLVKFDYPPISSLRECPRADPADLPNLFFTEDELDQIEDDRFNTKTADDVEIVAISSIKSGDGSLSDSRDSGNIPLPVKFHHQEAAFPNIRVLLNFATNDDQALPFLGDQVHWRKNRTRALNARMKSHQKLLLHQNFPVRRRPRRRAKESNVFSRVYRYS
jgi:hypothetical protein